MKENHFYQRPKNICSLLYTSGGNDMTVSVNAASNPEMEKCNAIPLDASLYKAGQPPPQEEVVPCPQQQHGSVPLPALLYIPLHSEPPGDFMGLTI